MAIWYEPSLRVEALAPSFSTANATWKSTKTIANERGIRPLLLPPNEVREFREKEGVGGG